MSSLAALNDKTLRDKAGACPDRMRGSVFSNSLTVPFVVAAVQVVVQIIFHGERGRQLLLCKGMNTTFQQLWPGERIYF